MFQELLAVMDQDRSGDLDLQDTDSFLAIVLQ